MHRFNGLLWSIPYFLAAYFSTWLITGTALDTGVSVWLPAGVAMAALMLTRPANWPAVIVGLIGAHTAFGVFIGQAVVHALIVGIALAAAPVIALAIVVRLAHVPLHGLYFLRALFFAALIDGLFASVIALSWQSSELFDLSSEALLRGAAHIVGIFVVTPVFTAWSRFRPSRQVMHGATERVIGALAFAALVPCAMLAFGSIVSPWLDEHITTALSYVTLVLCVLISLMWDARGGASSVLVLAVIALSQTMLGHGPFGAHADDTALIGVQTYLAVAAVLVLLSTVMHGHREKTLERAHRWRTSIELAMAGRGELLFCLDTKSGRIEWTGDVQGMTGHDPRSLSTLDAVIDATRDQDRAALRGHWLRAAAGASDECVFRLNPCAGIAATLVANSRAVGDLDDSATFVVGTWRLPSDASHGARA
jgi:hypothetical protein